MTKHSFFLLITFIFISCNKTEKPPISQHDIWNCHHQLALDSVQTSDALIGIWEWEYVSCFWTPEDANYEDYKGMTIEIKSDNTVEVKEVGKATKVSNWKIEVAGTDLFEIETEPYISQVYGRILFCKDRVEFNHSYIDLCDNYFTRQ